MLDLVAWLIGVIGIVVAAVLVLTTGWALVTGYELESTSQEGGDTEEELGSQAAFISVPIQFYKRVRMEADRKNMTVRAVVEQIFHEHFEKGFSEETESGFVRREESSRFTTGRSETARSAIIVVETEDPTRYDPQKGALDELNLQSHE